MSRSGYSDDCEYLELWRSNVERTLSGKRGQKFLVDLIQALDAMPDKRLIRNNLIEEHGEVCALGALGLKRGLPIEEIDPEDFEGVAKTFGISPMLAQEVTYQNDERNYRDTPEERWKRMREWAVRNLKKFKQE